MPDEASPLTYEISGTPERFDERDTVFARERLVSGSVEEQLYHAQHPEKAEVDKRLRAFIEGKDAEPRTPPSDWRQTAFYQATFGPIAGLALPDVVDGPVAPGRIEMEPSEAARRLKRLGRFLGADLVGIGPLNPAWVYSHRGSPPFFGGSPDRPPHFSGIPNGYADLKWGDPIELPHRFAIAMAFAQNEKLVRSFPSPTADLEVGRVYARAALAAVQLARFIRGLGYPARAHHLRNSCVVMVPVAVDAGLGELARSGYLLVRGMGLNHRLAIVTTDMPLRTNPPVDLGIQDFCEKCLKCAETCPANCIPKGEKVEIRGVRKWKIHEEKCLLYWGEIGVACTICQMVCPWSKPRNWLHELAAEVAVRLPWARRGLVKADDLVYGRGYRRKPEPDWLTRLHTPDCRG